MLVLAVAVMLAGCSSEEDNTFLRRADITLVTSLHGSGDLGYNDLILDGVCRVATSTGATLSVIRPASDTDLSEEVKVWLAEGSTSASLRTRVLIFSSMDYASSLTGLLPPDDRHMIFVVDGNPEKLPSWCHSINFDRYGASYLAGCMVGECPRPIIMAAQPDDPVLQQAIDGFFDGYVRHNTAGSSAPAVEYLADNDSGFASAEKAYRLCSSLPFGSFVFPLAGGSDSGVYKYLREHDFTSLLAAGMDVDCSAQASRVPFSLVVHADEAVAKTLTAAIQGDLAVLPSQPFGLESDYVDIVVNPDFYDSLITWEDYYDFPDYWEKRKASFLSAAIDAERNHSTAQQQ